MKTVEFTMRALFINGLIVLLMGGAAGYAVGRNYSAQETPVSAAPTVTPTPDVTPTPAVVTNIYTSPERFTFSYPESATVVEVDGYTLLRQPGPSQKEESEFSDGISLEFTSGTVETGGLEDVARWEMENMSDHEILVSLQPVTVQGIAGYTYKTKLTGDYTFTYLQLDDTRYLRIMDSTQDPSGQGFANAAQQIINSIQILPPEVPLSVTDQS